MTFHVNKQQLLLLLLFVVMSYWINWLTKDHSTHLIQINPRFLSPLKFTLIDKEKRNISSDDILFYLHAFLENKIPLQKNPLFWRCRGLNPGPFTCKANALPLRYIPLLSKNQLLLINFSKKIDSLARMST